MDISMSKGERTAQRILDHAEQLFAQRGYAATGIREIARAAQLREAGIYNHFPSKQALYSAVLERALSPLLALLDRYLEQLPTPSDQVLAHLPSQMTALLGQHPHIAILFQQALISRGQSEQLEMEDWLVRLIERGQALFHHLTGRRFSREETALRIVAIFNVTAGYFVAEPLLQHLSGQSAQALLTQQQHLADQLMRALLA